MKVGRPYSLSSEEENKVCELYASGLSLRKIVPIVNVCQATVMKVLKRQGIKTQKELAEFYGVSRSNISDVMNKKYYKSVGS